MPQTALLAIVIPVYKSDFLLDTLNSLSKQTCKNFNVYIGNDASPYNICSIIENFKDRLNIEYIRFPENMGSKNLVGQWNRCIDMVREEEWIWLFSDDDILAPNCVELFYNEISSISGHFDVYHFNVEQINEKGEIINYTPSYPEIISARDFLRKKTSGKIKSYVVEYIFNRSFFNEVGGFENFDLAWGSDDATWIKLAQNTGIKTIKGSKVQWRKSSQNISPSKDANISKRKIVATIEFFKWVKLFFSKNQSPLNKFVLVQLMLTVLRVPSSNIPFSDVKKIVFKQLGNSYIYFYAILYLGTYRALKNITERKNN